MKNMETTLRFGLGLALAAAALVASPAASRASVMYVSNYGGIEKYDTTTGADLGVFPA
jgi:hypothetical protein